MLPNIFYRTSDVQVWLPVRAGHHLSVTSDTDESVSVTQYDVRQEILNYPGRQETAHEEMTQLALFSVEDIGPMGKFK